MSARGRPRRRPLLGESLYHIYTTAPSRRTLYTLQAALVLKYSFATSPRVDSPRFPCIHTRFSIRSTRDGRAYSKQYIGIKKRKKNVLV